MRCIRTKDCKQNVKMKVVGEGQYGKVSVIRVQGKEFALKETHLSAYPEDLEVVMACLREEAMNCVHEHIIERYWCRFWEKKFQLCMELGQPVKRAPGDRILHDIGQALCFMHSKGFLHRDVKPDNIVKVGNIYKLIDFGLTRKKRGSVKMTGYMWSRWFRAPELLRLKNYASHTYDGRTDVWALGLSAYFLEKGEPLFYGSAKQILSMYSNYKPKGILAHIICCYEDRWTAKEMLEINGVDLIEGTMSEVKERDGNVGDFVRCLVDGNEDDADTYSHEKIYLDL